MLFGSEHFRAMQLLQGDEGAKTVLKAQASNVRFVKVDDAAILRDIDQPADLPSTTEKTNSFDGSPNQALNGTRRKSSDPVDEAV